jgi:hypothetical protein
MSYRGFERLLSSKFGISWSLGWKQRKSALRSRLQQNRVFIDRSQTIAWGDKLAKKSPLPYLTGLRGNANFICLRS